MLSDWLLTSALELFGQISVTADKSRPGPIPLNPANSLLVYPDNSDSQMFLLIDRPRFQMVKLSGEYAGFKGCFLAVRFDRMCQTLALECGSGV